jgi:hypothetical protein
MPSPNEPLVCQVVAWYFAKARKQEVIEIARPDQEHGNASQMPKAVERVYRLGTQSLSVEHTLLESFVGQTYDDKMFVAIMAPIEGVLEGKLPLPGSYGVAVNVGAFQKVKVKDYDKVRNELAAWVTATAPSLKLEDDPIGPLPVAEGHLSTSGIAVRLTRRPTSTGKVRVSRMVSDSELEPSRLERFKVALQAKCPKLAHSKSQCGGESVLALESVDIGLGGVGPAARALKAVEPSVTCALPDWILLIEPDRSGWCLSVLRRPDGTAPKAYADILEVPAVWLDKPVPSEAPSA